MYLARDVFLQPELGGNNKQDPPILRLDIALIVLVTEFDMQDFVGSLPYPIRS